MLSVAGGGQNIECTRLLLDSKCDLSALDPVQNNVLHIAAQNQNTHALDLLLDRWPKDLPLDLSLRNKQGETVYSIANDLKDEKALKILKSYEERYGDKSQQQTQDLLEDLMKEEERKELEKQKKKDKKKNHKLKHIAEKEGLSVEELKAKHQAENEAKRIEDERLRQEEEERIRQELESVAEFERRKQAREKAAAREEEVTEVRSAPTKKSATQKSVKFADEPVSAPIKSQTTLVETQFTHLKVKKPDEKDLPVPQPKI